MMTEKHPLQPFLPQNSKALFLGSFPPSRERWSMDFYYPNFQNDMWRIFGLVFLMMRSILRLMERKCLIALKS